VRLPKILNPKAWIRGFLAYTRSAMQARAEERRRGRILLCCIQRAEQYYRALLREGAMQPLEVMMSEQRLRTIEELAPDFITLHDEILSGHISAGSLQLLAELRGLVQSCEPIGNELNGLIEELHREAM
jgi:hypothetical protein